MESALVKIAAFSSTARAREAEEAVRHLLSSLLNNRELLLACVLSGRHAFLTECRKSFRGMLVTDDMLEHCWRYIECRKGPTPEFDFEWLVAQREQKEAHERAEAACLKELEARAHGKLAEEERNKFGEFN